MKSNLKTFAEKKFKIKKMKKDFNVLAKISSFLRFLKGASLTALNNLLRNLSMTLEKFHSAPY